MQRHISHLIKNETGIFKHTAGIFNREPLLHATTADIHG